jgi:hypothetical protein
MPIKKFLDLKQNIFTFIGILHNADTRSKIVLMTHAIVSYDANDG